MDAPPRLIGHVAALFRYPVKSLGAQRLSEAALDRHGIIGDRRLALRRVGDVSGFPWLTASRLPALIGYRTDVEPGDVPALASLRVLGPDGTIYTASNRAFEAHLATCFGVDVELTHLTHGMYDLAGISLLTTQALASLGALVNTDLDVRRFRPNMLISATESTRGERVGGDDSSRFPEDGWVGSQLTFGDARAGPRISVTERDERCSMIGIDPDSGAAMPQLLKAVVRQRASYAGVYAVPLRPGTVRVGDNVWCD